MKFLDLLRMSSTSLLKRKVRTILTVLGVTIGVASIVVMVSLGLGLNKSSLEEMESYGSLTAITVYEPGSYYDPSMDGSADSQEEKRLDDALVESIRQLPHVEMVSPMLNMSILARCGIYEGNLYIQAMSAEAFEAMKIPVGEGHYPDGKDGKLEFFYGNMALQSFYVASTGSYPYYERNELPDIDLMEDPIFYIFDMDAYYQSRYKSSGDGSGTTVAPPRRYMIDTAGIVAGGEEEWNSFSYNVYCEIEYLKTELKRKFIISRSMWMWTALKMWRRFRTPSILWAIRHPATRNGWRRRRLSIGTSSLCLEASARFPCWWQPSGSPIR